MLKYMFCLLLIGCSENTAVLSITPLQDWQSSIDTANHLTYTADTISIDGPVGQFKVVLSNLSDQPLTNVKVLVTANDPYRVVDFFTRIYRQLSWGASSFGLPTPITLPDNTELPTPFQGYYTVVDADDLPAHGSIRFDSIFLADPGLELHYQAIAELPSGSIANCLGQPETTVSFSF